MKVAYVSFAFGEYSVRLATALSRQVEVGVWLSRWQAEPHLDLLGPDVEFHPFNKPRMRQPHRQLPLIGRLIRQIRDFHPDVIHLQQGYLWFNPVLGVLGPAPLVVTVHDPEPHVGDKLGQKTPQSVARIAYRRASRVIVHNPQMAQSMAHQGVEPGRIDVVPTLVRGGEVEAAPAAPTENMVLFFGRIWEYKGLQHLIGAAPTIAREVPDVRFVIAGEGEDFDRYRRIMAEPERFEVHNEYVSQEKQAELFRRAAVVALPYIDATQSGVIPTAYNFSKPVVATTVGGLPSMVEHGHTGLLVPPGDEPALAEAVVRLLRDPQLRAEMGANGKARAEDEFSPESVADKTVEVYRRAIAASGSAAL